MLQKATSQPRVLNQHRCPNRKYEQVGADCITGRHLITVPVTQGNRCIHRPPRLAQHDRYVCPNSTRLLSALALTNDLV